VINDLEGGDPGPSRAGFVRAASIVLAFSALIGWAAVSSTVFRGPFATPHPAANAAALLADAGPRHTPMPFVRIEPASVSGPGGLGCVVPGSITTSYVFVGGQLVTVMKPTATSASAPCATFYISWQRDLLPTDRLAR